MGNHRMSIECLEHPDGRRIAYHRTDGLEPGVVFLGGFSSDMDGTKAVHLESRMIARKRAFLRFDYTGHGRSSGSFEEGCIGDWLGDAKLAIARLTDGPQVLVGSSMGGWIAMLLARQMPERIAGIVGIAAAPDFTLDFEEGRLDEGARQALETRGIARLHSDYSDEPMIVTRKLLQDGRMHLVFDDPLDLPFPTRFLQGTEDTDVDQSVAVRLLNHASGPDIQLLLVKGADHRFSSPRCLELIEQCVDSVLQASTVFD